MTHSLFLTTSPTQEWLTLWLILYDSYSMTHRSWVSWPDSKSRRV